jgi:anti-sigma-K factor RskA
MAATAALALYVGLMPTPGPSYIAVLIDANKTPILVAKFDAETSRLERAFAPGAGGGAPSRELWIVAGGNAPRSLGLLGDSETTVTLPADQAAALTKAILAISLEPPGGSKSGSPTEVLFTGAVVPANL